MQDGDRPPPPPPPLGYVRHWKETDKRDVSFPLLKSVSAVHSTANAYKYLCKSVPEIDD
jgi:hypothetical protein